MRARGGQLNGRAWGRPWPRRRCVAISTIGRLPGRGFGHGGAARRFGAGVVALALVIGPGVPATLAAGSIQLSTPYPAVAVQPGKTASFDLNVASSVQQRVNLAIVSAPADWNASLHGGGFVIDGVFAGPGLKPDVKIDVGVPSATKEGRFSVVVRASAGSQSATLSLDLRVAATAGGSVKLTTDNPALRDTADATFTYNLSLANDTPQDLTFSLATDGPAGWDVKATPSGQTQAATFVVTAGSSTTVSVAVKPATDAAANQYPIKVTATAGDQTASIDLQAEVIGKVDMQLTTPDQRLSTNANAGSTKDFQLVVDNKGTAPLTNVTVSSSAPQGWDIKLDPATVTQVAAGQTQTVTAHMTPSGNAIAGDYVVTFSAKTADGGNQDINVRVTVDTALSWGLIGIALILLTLVGLGWVFQRYGRR
jgi:uncharacterized repeat protein (TIGR01451 family)